MTLPRPLIVALGELERGVREEPGPPASPRIAEYLRGVGQAPDDEIPWCSAFVEWCVARAGIVGTRTARARSWLSWGEPTPARAGAVAVMWRTDPSGPQGHVGFLLDATRYDLYVLGGNQGDRVSVARFGKERILGYRQPTGGW